MSFKFMMLLTIVCSVGFFPVNAACENTAQNETPVYTNQDIEKYKKPSDSESQSAKTDRTADRKQKAQAIEEGKEKEYWCKNASRYRKNIEKAQDDITDIENRLSKGNLCIKSKKALAKSLEKARKKLKYAEGDFKDLEAEAHRKRIPPGWLRCQFE